MMKRIMPLLAVMALCLTACHRDPHFITDRNYRNEVQKDFETRSEALGLEGLCLDTLSRAEREAMQFLYAYMPYSDLADYAPEFFLQQVRYAFKAREEMPWGKEVPEDVFRHFVLVYRVNNENLDSARWVFYQMLRDRVKDMTMEEAALEVNHWCHEHVAYRAADARTSAPLATMRTSLGRCGEESTFAVTALRAVGIPARQCYTPRWAHCDDNHAWVEVFVDGEWKFLGACEPDPELNMGWFAVPSTRCLMVHSKAFGRYHGDEEVVRRTGLYSELNLLSHYAPTRRVTVTATDIDGKPLEGVDIKFKMYNYAEYYTLATYKSDARGQASLTTGLGDILVWATDGTHYNYAKVDVRQDSTVTLCLSREADNPYMEDIDIVPPVAGKAKVEASPEKVAANAKRLAYEDSLRNAYTATFPTKENYKQLLEPNPNLTDVEAWEIIHKSEGNYAEIAKFINSHKDSLPEWRHPAVYSINGVLIEKPSYHPLLYDYLRTYSDKDLRDITAEVLEAHADWIVLLINYEASLRGLMPARISNELVRPYREELRETFGGMSVEEIHRWVVDNIIVDDTGNYYNCPISPVGVYKLRHADRHSRDIFFVAACRAAYHPAYLDNATNTIYAWGEKGWEKRAFTSETSNTNATRKTRLTLTYRGKDPERPVYYPHFTLQKFENGDFRTFDFEDDPRMASFPATIDLEPGYYCLSTGRRDAEGTVYNRMEFFTVREGEHVTREIVLRDIAPKTKKAAGMPRMEASAEVMDGVTLGDYAGTSGCILAFLGPHREPAKHLVKELNEQRDVLKRWGGMLFVTTTDPANSDLRRLPNADVEGLASGKHDPLEDALATALGLKEYEYPLVAVVDREGHILFHHHGYSIGLAEQLLKVCTGLE
ncbi:MAG: transglutaminase domain-containing protein [Bacteroidales bacterium]|nr:transglutaminase domain-containing protein [Bacteroidales bacterium]